MEIQPSASPAVNRMPARSSVPVARLPASDTGVYFDASLDARERDAYYGIGPQTFASLHTLLSETHTFSTDYTTAVRVAPLLNLEPDGTLHCVYSGQTYLPPSTEMPDSIAELTRQDGAWVERWSQLAALASFHPEGAALQMALGPIPRPVPRGSKWKQVERGTMDPYGLEHSVAQSWFAKKLPMRTDFHILFPADPGANSERDNLPLRDVDHHKATHRKSGWSDGQSLEPELGKGELARATLYFLLRYPGEVDEYSPGDLNKLLEWHRKFPPDVSEKRRNAAIFHLQGNRNPLVDFPGLADKIDFKLGLRSASRLPWS